MASADMISRRPSGCLASCTLTVN